MPNIDLPPLDNIERPIHFIGIGGDGMSSLAGLLLEAGFSITGTQEAGGKVKQPRVIQDLEELGATIVLGHGRDYLPPNTFLVVRSSAVREGHDEIVAARERSLPVTKRASMLGAFMRRYATCVAVAGTAGKTTTSAMISFLLMNHGVDVGFSIGSPLLSGHTKNYKLGSGQCFVAEADEYDRSFLELPRNLGIVTELFFGDHPDYYADHDDLMSGFSAFVDGIAEGGFFIGLGDNQHVRDLGHQASQKFVTYGFSESCDFQISNCSFNKNGTNFVVSSRKYGKATPVNLKLVGRQNVANATAAIVAAHLLAVPFEDAARAVYDFPGTARRLERVGNTASGAIVYDDYAHNPVQIAASIAALKQRHPKAEVLCIFEPRQYRRTRMMLHEYAPAFRGIDHVLILDVSEGLGDLPAHRGSVHSTDLVQALLKGGVTSTYGGSREASIESIQALLPSFQVVITMGTGRLAEFARFLLTL